MVKYLCDCKSGLSPWWRVLIALRTLFPPGWISPSWSYLGSTNLPFKSPSFSYILDAFYQLSCCLSFQNISWMCPLLTRVPVTGSSHWPLISRFPRQRPPGPLTPCQVIMPLLCSKTTRTASSIRIAPTLLSSPMGPHMLWYLAAIPASWLADLPCSFYTSLAHNLAVLSSPSGMFFPRHLPGHSNCPHLCSNVISSKSPYCQACSSYTSFFFCSYTYHCPTLGYTFFNRILKSDPSCLWGPKAENNGLLTVHAGYANCCVDGRS